MKKIFLTLVSVLIMFHFSYAQWSANGNSIYNTNTGNVGIGTTTPSYKLELNGLLSSNVTGQAGIHIYNGGAVTEWLVQQKSQTSNNLTISSLVSGVQYDYFSINPNGNVLIGRTTQNNSIYMLDVNGPAHATSIVVNALGADFVFEPTYHLFPLSGLKKYIDQNHHLPEIPSAKQMQTDGLNVGDNQIKLLQKVEELTLYLIEKDNQLKQQQATIAAQNNRLQSEQEQIDLLKQQMAAILKQLNQKQ